MPASTEQSTRKHPPNQKHGQRQNTNAIPWRMRRGIPLDSRNYHDFASTLSAREDSRVEQFHRVSGETMTVVVFHFRRQLSPRMTRSNVSHLCYTSHVSPQYQTRVKLNRVFFPRSMVQARSPACGFAR